MKIKIDWNTIVNGLVIVCIPLLFGGGLKLYAQVKDNTKKAEKIDVVAKIVCLQAIENEAQKIENPDGPPPKKKKWNAEKICENIMNE